MFTFTYNAHGKKKTLQGSITAGMETEIQLQQITG